LCNPGWPWTHSFPKIPVACDWIIGLYHCASLLWFLFSRNYHIYMLDLLCLFLVSVTFPQNLFTSLFTSFIFKSHHPTEFRASCLLGRCFYNTLSHSTSLKFILNWKLLLVLRISQFESKNISWCYLSQGLTV
jgi:hypothetical protein